MFAIWNPKLKSEGKKKRINKDIYAWKYDMYQEQLLRWFLLSV